MMTDQATKPGSPGPADSRPSPAADQAEASTVGDYQNIDRLQAEISDTNKVKDTEARTPVSEKSIPVAPSTDQTVKETSPGDLSVSRPSADLSDTAKRSSQPLRFSPLIPQTVLEKEAKLEEQGEEEDMEEDKSPLNRPTSPQQSESDSDMDTIVKHFSENSQSTVVAHSREEGAAHYDSDMDTTSDGESRLVVDSDTRTDDGQEDCNSDDAEEEKPAPKEIEKPVRDATNIKMETVSSVSQQYAQMTNVPLFVMSRSLSTSGLDHAARREPMHSPHGAHIKMDNPIKDSDIGPNVINIIPSVVRDMDRRSDITFQDKLNGKRQHPSKAALKSLPANFPKLLEASTESLLKVNKPKPMSPLPQVVRDTGESTDMKMRLSNIEQLLRRPQEPDRALLPNVIPTHVREMSELQRPNIKNRDLTVIENRNVSRPQILNLSQAISTVKSEPVLKIPNSDDIKTEKVNISSPMISTPENFDLLKDPGSSEDQVNSILRKYNIFGPSAKREVSVKDMRRVIPQLIMCLFSKDDHHARKVKGLWEKKPTHWPENIPYCDPNNSNRGGEGGGKPKKETLHKMFGFLLDKYLHKVCKEGGGTLPTSLLSDIKSSDNLSPIQPTPPQPMYISSPSVETPYESTKDGLQVSKHSSQNQNFKNPLSIPSNVSVANKKVTFLATADLSAIVKQQTSEKLASAPETDKKFSFPLSSTSLSTTSNIGTLPPVNTLTNLHRSLPMNLPLPISPNDQPPPAKKGRLELLTAEQKNLLRSRLQPSGEDLPTVVRMYSPVRETPDLVKKSEVPLQKTEMPIKEETSPTPVITSAPSNVHHKPPTTVQQITPTTVHQMTPTSVHIGTFTTPQISLTSLAQYFQKQVPGSSISPGSMDLPSPQTATIKERLLSVPANLFNVTSAALPTTEARSSPAQMAPNLPHLSQATSAGVSVQQMTSATSPMPLASPLTAHPSLPINLPLPLASSVLPASQQIITTHPLSGIPIYMPNKDGTFLMPAVSQAGAVMAPQAAPSSQPQTPTAPAAPRTPTQAQTPTNPTGPTLAPPPTTTPEPSQIRPSLHPQAANIINLASGLKPIIPSLHSAGIQHQIQHQQLQQLHQQLPLQQSHKHSQHQPPQQHKSQPSEERAENISSSKTAAIPLLNVARDIILGTKRHKSTPPDISRESEAASAILLLSESVELQRKEGISGEKPTTPVIVSPNTWPEGLRVGDKDFKSLPSASATSPSKPSSAPYPITIIPQPITVNTSQELRHSSVSTAQSLDSGLSSMTPTIESLPSHRVLPAVSPSSETDSCDESLPLKISPPPPPPSSSEDNKPVSLILHNRTLEQSENESVSMEVSKEESFNPITDVMSRLAEKICRVESLNKEKMFPKKDLSILMIVYDILHAKKASLRQKDIMDFILTAHKLEASLDISLSQRFVPDTLRTEWRDYTDKFQRKVDSAMKIPNQIHQIYHVSQPDIDHALVYERCESIESQDSLTDFKEIKSAISEILEKTFQDMDKAETPGDLESTEASDIRDLQIKLRNIPDSFEQISESTLNDSEDVDESHSFNSSMDSQKKRRASSIEQRLFKEKAHAYTEHFMKENRHTSQGFHNYAKTQPIKTKLPKCTENKPDATRTNTDETIIRISSGQKCISLDKCDNPYSASVNDIKINLKFAICSDDLAKQFDQLSLTNDDIKDVTLLCFHDPKLARETNANDEIAEERIIQIVEDLRQSEHLSEPQDANDKEDAFPIDDVDIVVVDKEGEMAEDYEELPCINHLENFGNTPMSPRSPIMNTEEADLMEACGTTLFPSFDDMTIVNDMMAAIDEEVNSECYLSGRPGTLGPMDSHSERSIASQPEHVPSLYLGNRSISRVVEDGGRHVLQAETRTGDDSNIETQLPPFSSFVLRNGHNN